MADSILTGNRFPDKKIGQFKTAGVSAPNLPRQLPQAAPEKSAPPPPPPEGAPYACHIDKNPCVMVNCPKWIEVEEEFRQQYPFGGYCVEVSKDEAVEELAKEAKDVLNTVVETFTAYAPIVKSMVMSAVQKDMMSGKGILGGLFGNSPKEEPQQKQESETKEEQPPSEV